MAAAAVRAIGDLAEAGADCLRLLNFNIFPGLSCARLSQVGPWNFTLMDQVLESFMAAAGRGNASVIVDIETSPAWMWADANATDTHTCANAASDTLPVGPLTRCPHYGAPRVPRDKSWAEIADYFVDVADWYTRGGFTDSAGLTHISGHAYKFDYWEVLNEVNHPREHDFSPEAIVAFYDAQVQAFANRDGAPRPATKYMSASWGGMGSARSVHAEVGYFLNASNHNPPTTPVDAVSFHIYAQCDNNTAAGMEAVFPNTDAKIAGVVAATQLKQQLRPDVELHLTESGILCNAPTGCDVNNYSCWYTSFDDAYWTASSGQWLYQFLTYTKAGDLASVAHSQILGYPWKFDGLSGEWPCGTMVDFTQPGELNAKYWVTLLTLQSLTRPFKFCDTTVSVARVSVQRGAADATAGGERAADDDVFVQAMQSAKGSVVAVVNKRYSNHTVTIAGAAGKTASILDETTVNRAARTQVLTSDEVEVPAFATMFVAF